MDKVANKKPIGMAVLKSLLVSYITTGLLLLVLALLLFKLDLNEGKISAGIIVIYIVSSFLGGFIIGKIMKSRKFMWGLIMGCAYFLILAGISLAVNNNLQSDINSFVTTFIMCAGGGMLGGMLS